MCENFGIAMPAIKFVVLKQQSFESPHDATDTVHDDGSEQTAGEHAGDALHDTLHDVSQPEVLEHNETSLLLFETAGLFKKLMQPRLVQIIGDGPA